MKKEIKNILHANPLSKWLLDYHKQQVDKKLAHLRAPYIPRLEELIDNNTSIISSNCFAGRIMQDIGMQYNTPTLGLYFWSEDYIEFLQHLEFYLKEAKITFVEKSKYPLGNERRSKWNHWYPIGLLNKKVEIHFLHYYTEKEAAEKWYRRATRVNMSKLLIIGMEQNLCQEKDIYTFDQLPYKNKYFFSTKNIQTKSNIFITEFAKMGEVGDPYKMGHIFYKYLTERMYSNINTNL